MAYNNPFAPRAPAPAANPFASPSGAGFGGGFGAGAKPAFGAKQVTFGATTFAPAPAPPAFGHSTPFATPAPAPSPFGGGFPAAGAPSYGAAAKFQGVMRAGDGGAQERFKCVTMQPGYENASIEELRVAQLTGQAPAAPAASGFAPYTPAPAPPAFGQTSPFGAKPNPFGSPAAPAPAFGASGNNPFAARTPTPAANPFGAKPAGFTPAPAPNPFAAPKPNPFGAATSPFGAPAPASPFGAPAPAPANPFAPGNPFGGAPAPAAPFGAAPAPANPFAPAPAPFAAPANPFAPAPANPFAAPAPANPFGAPAPAAPFGAPAPANPFAPAPAAANNPFAPAAPANPFAPKTTANPFGSPAPAPAYGAPFGTAPAPAAANPFAPKTTNPFAPAAPAPANPFSPGAAANPFSTAGANPFSTTATVSVLQPQIPVHQLSMAAVVTASADPYGSSLLEAQVKAVVSVARGQTEAEALGKAPVGTPSRATKAPTSRLLASGLNFSAARAGVTFTPRTLPQRGISASIDEGDAPAAAAVTTAAALPPPPQSSFLLQSPLVASNLDRTVNPLSNGSVSSAHDASEIHSGMRGRLFGGRQFETPQRRKCQNRTPPNVPGCVRIIARLGTEPDELWLSVNLASTLAEVKQEAIKELLHVRGSATRGLEWLQRPTSQLGLMVSGTIHLSDTETVQAAGIEDDSYVVITALSAADARPPPSPKATPAASPQESPTPPRFDPRPRSRPVPGPPRDGCETTPPYQELQLMRDDQLQSVLDFTITCPEFGSVTWPGRTDLRGVDLSVVHFEYGNVEVYPDTPKPPVGKALNKVMIMALNVAPPTTKRHPSAADVHKFKKELQACTAAMPGATFVGYENGVWTFTVDHLSDDVDE